MGITGKARAFRRTLKLDSHHAIERFGVFVAAFALTGIAVISGSVISALQTGSDVLSRTALYTTTFTTSKTALKGDVDGVFTNTRGDKTLVMMHFPASAAISHNAADYQAFLLGSDTDLTNETVTTSDIAGTIHVFGSTGYLGILLTAHRNFDEQVLNLTIRANAELSYDETVHRQAGVDEMTDDASFRKFDQWRVFINPGATAITTIPALDAPSFDPTRAYYDVVLKPQEGTARAKLDQKLLAMRANLAQIESYTSDLRTTQVDGLFLRPPPPPAMMTGDKITGVSAAEARDGVSTLTLHTDHVVPGGLNLSWRTGDVYHGYLDVVVPPGQNYAEFLARKRDEKADTATQQISDMPWILSDGSNLRSDYQTSDVTMRPLTTVMNNLSQAYQDYAKNKAAYQSELTLDLLRLDANLRDVRSNSSVHDGSHVVTTLY
ncbi:hypothetical protein [Amycolatopsis sp. PS_44_ISF1]|uniref:hypothetical protein n=1 Tax=Amycolatopsis sp. PS_44_ISF1 TaxID=2974917 RepID=UPI0028E04C0B|nr:hypothetical protein [Amycolatopsis sp. PS_44_ISF1]MDT8913566.1 hypothetical protein [Amycolatopsis sp. PS_44_ISF1]